MKSTQMGRVLEFSTGVMEEENEGQLDCQIGSRATGYDSRRCRKRTNTMQGGKWSEDERHSQSQTFLPRTRAWSIIQTNSQTSRQA